MSQPDEPGRPGRDYRSLADAVAGMLRSDASREERMQAVADAGWERLSLLGVSWIGFYLRRPEAEEMVLGASRNKPACSPIGLHGACGQSLLKGRSLVVTDVAKLGEGYIACDPLDRAEVVVPMFDDSGACWGVLDADSFAAGAFTKADAEGLWSVCFAAGLTTGVAPGIELI